MYNNYVPLACNDEFKQVARFMHVTVIYGLIYLTDTTSFRAVHSLLVCLFGLFLSFI